MASRRMTVTLVVVAKGAAGKIVAVLFLLLANMATSGVWLRSTTSIPSSTAAAFGTPAMRIRIHPRPRRRGILHPTQMPTTVSFPPHPPVSERRLFLAVMEDSHDSIHHHHHHEEEEEEEGLVVRSLDDAFREIAHLFTGRSTAEIQTALVQKGIAWVQTQTSTQSLRSNNNYIDDDTVDDNDSILTTAHPDKNEECWMVSSWRKVPGCISTVHIQTTCRRCTAAATDRENNHHNITNHNDATVVVVREIRARADAYVSRGLLACLCATLRNVAVADVLALSADTIGGRMGIQAALSPGRNDGLASMLRTVQSQIRHECLASFEQQSPDRSHHPNEGVIHDTFTAADAESLYKTASATATSTTSSATNSITDPSLLRPLQNAAQHQSTEHTRTGPTVALLLSGGVDSSVALHRLLHDDVDDQKYNVTAFYLKIWLADELAHLGECPWAEDYQHCLAVCQQANVPLETISLQHEYQTKVISYTIDEAKAGRTPNPDIFCNSRIKFGCFYDYAITDRHFDYVATGHYAQLQRDDDDDHGDQGRVRLLRAPDPVKDQSYFLCTLTQEQLRKVLFPIGHLHKSAVRDLAREWHLPNRHRPDSQGLCFLGKVKFDDFLGSYLEDRPGPIVDATTGELLGRHRGLWYHTIGQRKGIGKVLTPTATSRGPWYVVAKQPSTDTVFCSNQYDESIFAASRSEFAVENIHWISGTPSLESHCDGAGGNDDGSTRAFRLTMKIRHGPKLVSGTLTLTDDNVGHVRLDSKDSGLAPGQYVVFYHAEECLGGGVISERQWANFLLDSQQRQAFAVQM